VGGPLSMTLQGIPGPLLVTDSGQPSMRDHSPPSPSAITSAGKSEHDREIGVTQMHGAHHETTRHLESCHRRRRADRPGVFGAGTAMADDTGTVSDTSREIAVTASGDGDASLSESRARVVFNR